MKQILFDNNIVKMLQVSNEDMLNNPPVAAKSALNPGTTFLEKVMTKVNTNGKFGHNAVANTQKYRVSGDRKVYVCKYCCYRCHNPDFLQNHIANHGANPKHVCYECGHSCNTFSSLMVHFLKHSNSNKRVKLQGFRGSRQNSEMVSNNEGIACSNCKIVFKNVDQLQYHDCKIFCHKNLVSNVKFDSHESTDLKDEGKHPQCYPSKNLDHSELSSKLSNNIEENEQNKFIRECSKNENGTGKNSTNSSTSVTPQAVRKSVRLGKKKRRIFSETASKDAENQAHEVKQHIQGNTYDVAMYDKLELLCQVCSLSFTNRKNMLRHQQMHTEKPSFMCKFCGKFFHRKDIHNRHEKTVHRVHNCKARCYYCKYVFYSFPALKDHVMSAHHDGEIQHHDKIPCHSVNSKIKNSVRKYNQEYVPSKSYLGKHQSISSVSHKANEFSRLDVKEEITSDPPSHGNGVPMKYKCGKCLKPFNVLQHLWKHFQSVHDVSSGSPKNVIENSPKSLSDNCESNNSLTEDSSSFASSSLQFGNCAVPNVNSFNESSEQNCLNVASYDFSVLDEYGVSSLKEDENHTYDLLNGGKKNVLAKVSDWNQEAMEISSFGKSIENVIPSSSNETCSLCLQNFSCQSAFLSHQQYMHKVVHWCRCSICGRCGPKKSVAEHMLSHMQEIGSFVVNGNEQNFNNILQHLPPSVRTMINSTEEFVFASETVS